jgi:O-acetylserine/cysteine efflux transporter
VPLKDALLAVMVVVIWGTNFVVVDEGLDGVPALLFVAMRFVVVLLPAIFFVPRPNARWQDVAAIGAFMSFGQFGLLYLALELDMPPGLASLVLQAQVLLTVLIATLSLGERPTRRQVVAVAIGGLGLAVVGVGRSASTPLVALLLTLAAALAWAIGNVLSRRVRSASGLSLTVWSGLVVPVPMFLLSLVVDGPAEVGHALTHLPASAIWATAYTAYLASLVGYGTWNLLLGRHPAAAVVPFALLVPVVGILTAWIVQGETPNLAESVGGALLLLGVAAATLRPRRPAPEPVSVT